eukprot:229224-Chlamydomonas_euryale.AAC.2
MSSQWGRGHVAQRCTFVVAHVEYAGTHWDVCPTWAHSRCGRAHVGQRETEKVSPAFDTSDAASDDGTTGFARCLLLGPAAMPPTCPGRHMRNQRAALA